MQMLVVFNIGLLIACIVAIFLLKKYLFDNYAPKFPLPPSRFKGGEVRANIKKSSNAEKPLPPPSSVFTEYGKFVGYNLRGSNFGKVQLPKGAKSLDEYLSMYEQSVHEHYKMQAIIDLAKKNKIGLFKFMK